MWSGSPRCTARAKKSFIRLGWGMTRFTYGGQALRTVALLPGVTGAYGRYGGGALLVTAASFELNYNALRKPSGPAATRTINHNRLGEALLELKDPPIRALFIAANNPAVTCPDSGNDARGLAREDLFTVVHDPFMTDDRALRRYRAAGDDVSGDRGFLPRLRHLLHAIRAARGAAAGRGVVEPEAGAGVRRAHGRDRPGVSHVGAGDPARTVPRRDRNGAEMDPDTLRDGAAGFDRTKAARNFARHRANWSSIPRRWRAGIAADAGLAARSGTGAAVAMAAAAADRARIFPEPHCIFRRGVPARARGARRSACCIRPTRRRAACATASACAWSTIAALSG